MAKDAIFIRNLVKEYTGIRAGNSTMRALDGLDLTIKQGSIFGLLGPNGAGKSSLINILAGTVLKTSGQVKIMDISIDELPKKARSLIGIVPQEIIFDTFFPIYKALEFYAGYYGIRPHLRKTEEILKALSLWDKRDAHPQHLSGGMKRRFLIAKAMVHSPPVLVLDEPTAGVDLELRTQLWDYIKLLNKQGVTIIITTHYLAEAQELCDEICFINKGKIIKQGTQKSLLEEFGTRYVDVEFERGSQSLEINLPAGSFESLTTNKIRFQVNEAIGNDYSQIIQNINSLGMKVKELEVLHPDLEDIFHKIIHQ